MNRSDSRIGRGAGNPEGTVIGVGRGTGRVEVRLAGVESDPFGVGDGLQNGESGAARQPRQGEDRSGQSPARVNPHRHQATPAHVP